MKKALLMIAAALTAWSASAQLYVTGGAVDGCPSAWDPANPLEVALTSDGYTFKATGGFKISTSKGTWTDFNGNALTLNGSWSVNGDTATGSLVAGDADIAAAKADAVVTYTVNSECTTISASLAGGEIKKYFQVHGSIFGVESWSSEAMTEQTNGTWSWTGEVKQAGGFGIKICNEAGSQIGWIGGAATITEADHAYAFVAGDNSSSTLVGEYTIVYDPAAETISFNGQSGVEVVEAAAEEAVAVYYNLQGIRVAAPEAGQLYIVNRAGKISKELAR